MEKEAKTLKDIPSAIQFNIPVRPEHVYFTDFSGFRGRFEENVLYRLLNFDVKTQTFDYERYSNLKRFIFFVGMRGSGKTTELFKYRSKLENPAGFYTVYCSIDEELDVNDLEYMDIIIFQLEKLIERVKDDKIGIEKTIISSMNNWFEERVNEINKKISAQAGIELEIEAGLKTPIIKLFSLVGKLKSSLTATKENAEIIRKTFRYRFGDFALKFNEFLENVNNSIRKKDKGKEVLFLIDGLEKTLTADIRRKIVMDETNRIKQIKAYTIFTLPIELIKERNRLRLDGFEFIIFPFIKISDVKGGKIQTAYNQFREFIYKRIDKKLFTNQDVVDIIIKYSGGSPREALRIIHYAWQHLPYDAEQIGENALNKGLNKLAEDTTLYLTDNELEKLKKIKELNNQDKPVPYDETIQEMVEKLIIMEYNEGNLKRVNPIITLSKIYKTYVG